jgi:hypothetical protein
MAAAALARKLAVMALYRWRHALHSTDKPLRAEKVRERTSGGASIAPLAMCAKRAAQSLCLSDSAAFSQIWNLQSGLALADSAFQGDAASAASLRSLDDEALQPLKRGVHRRIGTISEAERG